MKKKTAKKATQKAQQVASEIPKDCASTFMGLPMNWDLKNAHKDLWNPESDEFFPAKHFGIGWSINFHAVAKSFGYKGNRTRQSP